MPRRVKKEKPYIVVFCEGESEQAYIDFLKKEFRDVASIKRPSATGLFEVADDKFKKDKNIEIILRSRMRFGFSLTWKQKIFQPGMLV